MKRCNKCQEEKQLEAFSKNKRTSDGLERRCRTCERARCKSTYIKRRDKALAKCKEYREANKDYYQTKIADWRRDNPDYMKEWQKANPEANTQWYRDNPEKRRAQKRKYEKKRRAQDPMHRLRSNMRSRIWHYLNDKGWKKSTKTHLLIGCSWAELYNHVQSQLEPWMNESNYGKCIPGQPNVGWDIDHIIPLASAQNEEDLIKLCHYTNLKPVCSNYNRYVKRNKLQN